jgi:hypothetical protein
MTGRIDEAIEALLAYQQADMEGVMVLTSRQAIHEVADELRRLRDPAQATLWPDIKQLHDAIAECIGREGLTYPGIRRAAKRVQELYAATIAAQPPAAPVETATKSAPVGSAPHNNGERLPNGDVAAAGADTRCSAGTDQEGWDLVAKSWVVLESYGFAPEACDYLPQAIDNALAAVIGARDDLLAEVTRLRAAPQSPLEWLAGHTNYELSFSGWDEDPAWLVHSVNGGRNDREWTLLSTGSTPEEALRKAMARTVTRPHEKSRGAEFPSHGRNTP